MIAKKEGGLLSFSSKQKEYFMNATHRWNIKTG